MRDNIVFQSPLAPVLRAFVQEKQAHGYKYVASAKALRRLDRMWSASNDMPPALSQAWAERFIAVRPGESPRCPQVRASLWRELARHARRKGIEAYVPETHMLPLFRSSFTPFIYTRTQLAALFSAAEQLPVCKMSPRRPWSTGLLLRLLYGTGMRLGEALRLNLRDFDPLNQALTIYQTKNQTERMIPLAPALSARVQAYIERFPGEADTPLFLSPRGPHSLGVGPVDRTFKILLIKAGLPQRIGRTGPRVHDLRHSFAVHRLENWYYAGENLEAKLPLLATYLGHACLRDTYYYLRITTSFFPEIARRLNAFTGNIIPQGGQS